MFIEHFDKCSDLKNFTDKYIDENNITGVTESDLKKCSLLAKLTDTHYDENYIKETPTKSSSNISFNLPSNLSFKLPSNLPSNLNNDLFSMDNLFKHQVYIYIFATIIVNIFLSLFIIPIIFSGGILTALFIILLSIIILGLILKLFSKS
jgi:hypothetical protein